MKVIDPRGFKKRQKHPVDMPVGIKFLLGLSVFVFLMITVSLGAGAVSALQNIKLPKLVWEEEIDLSAAPPCREVAEPNKTYQVIATAYSSEVAQTDNTPCITATGYDVCENYAKYGAANTIASNFLPLHAIVKIPELYGDQVFVVRDRMNARYGYNRIDVWLPTKGQAVRFGAKKITIEVY